MLLSVIGEFWLSSIKLVFSLLGFNPIQNAQDESKIYARY